jgi:hypothetical protein
MSLLLVEGFDGLGALADKYTVSGTCTLDSSIKRTGARSLKLATTASYIVLPIIPNTSQVYLGFGYYTTTLSANKLISFRNNSGEQCAVYIATTGEISVKNNTTVLGTSVLQLAINTWYYIEVKCTVSDSVEFSTPYFSININDVEWLSLGVLYDTIITTPLMTSNTTPSGVCSASSTLGAGSEAYRAFDTLLTNQWHAANVGCPHWLKYQFPTAETVVSYEIFCQDSYWHPINFKLQGSNDNSIWTDLDTRTGISMTSGVKYTYNISSPDSYTYYRLYISISNNGGAYASCGELRLLKYGTTELTYDTQQQTTTGIDYIWLYGAGGTANYIDDIYISDASGSFLGPCSVTTLFPTGSGTTSQFVGSDSNSVNNYQLIDDTTHDVADYVQSNVVGDIDLYTYPALAYNPDVIHAVDIVTYNVKTDVGRKTLVPVSRISGENYTGEEKEVETPLNICDMFLPLADVSPWTQALVNASEFGIKLNS